MALNATAVGRRLVLSRTTAMSWIRAYEKAGLLRLLPFYGARRRPLLLVNPDYSEIKRSFGPEELIERLQAFLADCRFFWWKTGRVRALHLVAELPTERIGFCFSTSPMPRHRDWLPLAIALKQGVIHRGFLLHSDTGASCRGRSIVLLPLRSFLQEPEAWILERRTWRDGRDALQRINRERLARWAGHG
jgi:hypothetical protein